MLPSVHAGQPELGAGEFLQQPGSTVEGRIPNRRFLPVVRTPAILPGRPKRDGLCSGHPLDDHDPAVYRKIAKGLDSPLGHSILTRRIPSWFPTGRSRKVWTSPLGHSILTRRIPSRRSRSGGLPEDRERSGLLWTRPAARGNFRGSRGRTRRGESSGTGSPIRS